MTENIKSKTSSKKEGKKINKPSDLDLMLEKNKNLATFHQRTFKTLNPRDLKKSALDLDKGSVSVRNIPSEKNGERIEVQFESLPLVQLLGEKFYRFNPSSLYLQESVIAKEESRGGVLNKEDLKKIIDQITDEMKSLQGKIEKIEKEFSCDVALPEEKTYKLVYSQNSYFANHLINQAQKADRIICVLDYLYSKGKLGFLTEGMKVRNKKTTEIIQLLSCYMDKIINLEGGVRSIRSNRQRDRDLEEQRLKKQREEEERQAEHLRRIHKHEGEKARKEKAQMRATAKVYRPDENGRMVLVETRPERRTQTPLPTATVSAEQVEQDEPKQEPQQIQAETVKQEPADSVLPEPPEVIEVPVEQAEETKPVSEVATQQSV